MTFMSPSEFTATLSLGMVKCHLQCVQRGAGVQLVVTLLQRGTGSYGVAILSPLTSSSRVSLRIDICGSQL